MLTFTDIPEFNKEIIEQQSPVKVIFRKWKNGDIIAVFPELPGTLDPSTCESYEHVGQHGACDSAFIIQATDPAIPEEYADLKAELERIGYVLEVRTRMSLQMYVKRKENLKPYAASSKYN